MAYEVFVEKRDNSSLIVYSDEPCVHEELYEKFKVKDPSHTPSRFSKYDGMVRLYDKSSGTLPIGLLPKLLKNLKNYKVTVDNNLKNFRSVTDEELKEWIITLSLPFELYEFQFNIIRDFIKYRRLTALADTCAGKSVVIYVITRFLLEANEGCTLIMVPTILLVNQILDDFISYGWKDARGFCQQIYDGSPKTVRKRCVISTWQSIQNMSTDYFDCFTSVIVDEVHGASAKKQSKIVQSCRNACDKIGLTGTLRGTELHEYQVEGLFGTCKVYVETQQLKDMGQAAQTQIYMMYLKYQRLDNIRVSKLDYEGSIQFLLNHPSRMEIIGNCVKGASNSNENSLVIFERVEDGIYKFVDTLIALGLGDKVRVIESSVKLSERDAIKAEMEVGTGLILLATWGTMSTGVSIKNLHNLFFGSNSKGIIRILQSVGRLLRIHESKAVAKIVDFVDDTRTTISSRGVFVEHAKERFGFYTMKKHPVKMKIINVKSALPKEVYEEILRDSDERKRRKELTEA